MQFLKSVERKLRDVRNIIRRTEQNRQLRVRWNEISANKLPPSNSRASGLNKCKVVYINLEHRGDRKSHIESEFGRLKISNFNRFRAISDKNGALGCAFSHGEILRSNAITDEQLLMICEDDCQFTVDRMKIDSLIEEFFQDTRLDVLCLAYNAENGFKISEKLMVTSNTATMSCYIVKSHSLRKVLASVESSIAHLSAGRPTHLFAIDQTWKQLQQTELFAIPIERAAIQMPSFSDIENEYSDYGL
tara:strand:- start:112 stop:852 length:741 start_codon:yes stop_codon:yes gene_type:complete